MIVDNLIAIRILYLLVTPFEKQEAYRQGVIDTNGNPLLKLKDMSPEQKSNYTMLHRLVFRLKKVLGTIPFGKTTLASMAAAYLLVRESVEAGVELDNLEEVYENVLKEYSKDILAESIDEFPEQEIIKSFELLESITKQMKSFGMQLEDPVSTTGGMAGYSMPLKKQPKKVAIFDVPSDTFKKFKKGKSKNERWDKFLNLEDEGQSKVREYIKKNPNGILVLRCSESGQGQVVRYRKLEK